MHDYIVKAVTAPHIIITGPTAASPLRYVVMPLKSWLDFIYFRIFHWPHKLIGGNISHHPPFFSWKMIYKKLSHCLHLPSKKKESLIYADTVYFTSMKD